MAVVLTSSNEAAPTYEHWVVVGATKVPGTLRPERRRPDIGAALSDAFDAEAQVWWRLAGELRKEPSAHLAHTPACVANASDFGLMLAWTRLVDQWIAETTTTLFVCDDPWLFRHLAGRPGIGIAGRPPALWPTALRMTLRGLAARSITAVRLAAAAVRLRHRRPAHANRSEAAILVYGHPRSNTEGWDAYFGNLMQSIPPLVRMLHVDCDPARAHALGMDGRTFSLHAWGSPWFPFVLPFARWRPSRRHRNGPFGWLIRRAAAREGSTGQAAMIGWQCYCQTRWLRDRKPAVVAWPWENHSWERAFARTAATYGVRRIGYQHSVVGRQMLNYATFSDLMGSDENPDMIVCTGTATRDQLARWGASAERLTIGGALRFPRAQPVRFDRAEPIFVALPFSATISAAILACLRKAASKGWRFVVKDHPMTPVDFDDSPGVRRTQTALTDHAAVGGVVYAATTVGLEAVLLDLPTIRFRPDSEIALDILPAELDVPAAGAADFEAALERLAPPKAVSADAIFAPIDLPLWACMLASGKAGHS